MWIQLTTTKMRKFEYRNRLNVVKAHYQVWLDTIKFDANNKDNIQTVGITDNYDKDKLTDVLQDIQV